MTLSSLRPLPIPPLHLAPESSGASSFDAFPSLADLVASLMKTQSNLRLEAKPRSYPTFPQSSIPTSENPVADHSQALEIPPAPLPRSIFPKELLPVKAEIAKTVPIFQPVPVSPNLHSNPHPPEKQTTQEPDFTDDDLRQALAPLIHGAIRSRESRLHLELEPMLRATVRRSLAEFSSTQRPFRAPRWMDRTKWRLEALFTSRTYEEILFKKTHRFQVDEVFALDAASLSLISYASCDPARHSTITRITPTVHRLASQLRDQDGRFRPMLELPDRRTLVSFRGRWIILMALVRGKPNEFLTSDMEYSLERIEERFKDRFKTEGSPLLQALQPFLEDCLLIQAPTSNL
ncbi:hypothetical protein JIN85_11150 [Luteolibacter pohnpeiensis]|uniref:Uncharacterized protein n=1 Tax=Luteolibacter pohnpeiensis TaxID=454153 RepID=A0A934S7Z2_9BACT|nr:hypothetical protein [Luteolibacter pohnpeiensis]MBK1882975.1 hypothetical protein [Luteolibacter pohnpeiensis]